MIRIPAFRSTLLSWYRAHKRDLPFRKTSDPYRIWLSEIMLQQTTVATVIPYYEKFLARFPDPASVARADEAELLTLWQGLGYYSRIRNFKHACARIVADGGKFPLTSSAWKKLPGVGDYTASAVASIAFDEPVAVVDGNVKRVLARLFRYEKDIVTTHALEFFRAQSAALLAPDSPGDFNQAMMELGALKCRPKAPSCPSCPVRRFCASFGKNPERLPVKRARCAYKATFHSLIIRKGNALLLKQPASDNLIAGMWELPGLYRFQDTPPAVLRQFLGGKLNQQRLVQLGAVSHAITRYRITNRIYAHAPIPAVGDYRYVALSAMARLPVNTLSRKVLRKFL